VDYVQSGALSAPSEAGGRTSGNGRAGGSKPGPRAAVTAEWLDVEGMFRQHHGDLVRLALLLVGDGASAEDVVQDVFTRLCASGRELDQDRALAYIRTAVVNGCRSLLRRRVIARRVAATRTVWRDTQESAEHTALLAEDRRRVLAALAALPSRRREVLVLRYYLNLPVAEVAAILGISEGAVKSAASRGLAALARRLGEEQ
jgi:RNA polymerase sigma-70 factor (sigma-E family)